MIVALKSTRVYVCIRLRARSDDYLAKERERKVEFPKLDALNDKCGEEGNAAFGFATRVELLRREYS